MMRPSNGCVFLAYDWPDMPEAEALGQRLEHTGFNVWLPGRETGPIGSPEAKAAVRAAVGQSASFLLVLSGRAVDLNTLGDLTQTADSAGKPIFAIRVGEQAQIPAFPALSRAKAWIDLAGPAREQEFGRLSAGLAGYARQRSAAPLPPTAMATQWGQTAPAGSTPQPSSPRYGGMPPQSNISGAGSWQQSTAFKIVMMVGAAIMILSGLIRVVNSL